MAEKNLFEFNLAGKNVADRIESIIKRAMEFRVECARTGASVDIAVAFALVVENFLRTLPADQRADFEKRVRTYAAITEAAEKMTDGMSLSDAAEIVRKEIA